MFYMIVSLYFITNYICYFVDRNKNHPFLFIWLFNFIFVAMPSIFWYFNSPEWYVFLLNFLLFSSICNIVYVLSCFFLQTIYPASKINPLNLVVVQDVLLLNIFWFVFILLFFVFLIRNLETLPLVNKDIFYTFYLYIFIFVSSYSLYILYSNKRMFFVYLMVAILTMLLAKSRGALGYVVIPFVYYYFINKFTFMRMIALFFGSFFLFFLVVAMKAYRWAVAGGSFDLEHFLWVIGYQLGGAFEIGDLSIIRWSKAAFEMCSASDISCGSFTEIKKLFTSFVFSSEKDLSSSYLIWNYVMGESDIRGSLHALSYGIAYLDGYWFGFIYFFLLALLRHVVLIQITKMNFVLLLAPSLYFVLFFSRGSVFNGLVPLLMSVFICWLFSIYVRWFKVNRDC